MAAGSLFLNRTTRVAARAIALAVAAVGALSLMFGVTPLSAMGGNSIDKVGVAQSPAGSTTETLEGTLIDWTIALSSDVDELQYDVEIVDTLASNLALEPGSVSAPSQWSISTAGPLTFDTAVLPPQGGGFAVSTQPKQTLISGGAGGGDGYVPLFGADGRIYFTFHHAVPGRIQCIDPASGAVCAGYPIIMNVNVSGAPVAMMTPSSANGATIIGNRLYQAGRLTGTDIYGLGCWDLTTGLECANRAFITFPHPAGFGGATGSQNHNYVQGPYLIGSNFYMWDSHQNVQCVDSVTWAACAGYPVSMLDPVTLPRLLANPQGTGLALGSRLYFGWAFSQSTEEGTALNEATMACFDTATNAECNGWNGGASTNQVENWVYGIWFRYNTSGVADAVCEHSFSARNGACLSLVDGSVLNDQGTRGIPPKLYQRNRNEGHIIDSAKHPVLNRTYFSNYGNGLEVCWDWTTGDWCLANFVGAPGDLNTIDVTGDGYVGDDGRIRSGINSQDYGARYDPTTGCWWSIGNTTLLWSFDDAGNVPCVPRTVAAEGEGGFAAAYCRSGRPDDLVWTAASVENLDPADWASFVVTLTLPDGTPVGTIDAVNGTSTVDISGLDPAVVDTISYEIAGAMAAGRNPTDDVATTPILAVSWDSASAAEFCYQTRTIDDPCATATAMNAANLRVSGDLQDTASQSFDVLADPLGKCYSPAITFDKTVYAGHDGGTGCNNAVANLPVDQGGDVTWCFTVTNSGDSHLDAVTITDPGLPGSPFTVPGQLAPGESQTLTVESSAGTADLTNNASATATPVLPDGTPLEGALPPEGADGAALDVYLAALMLQKTVYAGHDAGASCPGAGLAMVDTAEAVTWCFTITNTGDTNLTGVTVDDPAIGVSGLAAGDLAPGATTTVFVEALSSADITNSASATGTPTDEAGMPLPNITSPTGSGTAELDVTPPVPDVEPGMTITKTILAGHQGVDACPGAPSIAVLDGQPADVTWCITVVNTGDTILVDVVVNDPVLPGSPFDLGALAPGASRQISAQTTQTGDFSNTATATATPTADDGTPYEGIDEVLVDTTAEVDAVPPATVSGVVFDDKDSDGTQDPGDGPLPEATVTLTGTDINGDPVRVVVRTRPDGSWDIPGGLLPSDSNGYKIVIEAPTGDLRATTPTEFTVDVPAGADIIVDPTGFASPAQVTGTLFYDDDLDSSRGSAETGVSGVTLELSGTDVTGKPVLIEVTTDEDGNYDFGTVLPSDSNGYALTIRDSTLPDGVTITSSERSFVLAPNQQVEELFPVVAISDRLAFTGTTAGTLVPVGLMLIVGGFGILTAVHRRRNPSAAAS